MEQVTATANANIAIIKYWGKRDTKLNLPAVGSISLTLGALKTKTTIEPNSKNKDEFYLNNENNISDEKKVFSFIKIFREMSGNSVPLMIHSDNNFPTGAGLASSASGYAALAVAANEFYRTGLSRKELSVIARQGSGSAARSIFGGIVEMLAGIIPDGSDAYAEQLYDEQYWDLRVLIVVTEEAQKDVKSRPGMEISRETSPYYRAWVENQSVDLAQMKSALKNKDFQKLGELAEHSCMKMHAVMLSSIPPLIYWNPVTLELIQAVIQLRKNNIQCYYTIDAGPQVKIITLPEYESEIREILNNIPGIKRIIGSKLGEGASVIE
ncbi:MAG: diphosphomevalonate decarboxylase [Calditrichia bacterium]